jgi:hypothetical protein
MTVAAQLRARSADDRPGLVCAADGESERDTWSRRGVVQECAGQPPDGGPAPSLPERGD